MGKIHEAMAKAMDEICRLGIAKTQKNTQQGYNFRGIDAAMSEMSPILVRNGITVTPEYSEASFEWREKDAGKFLRFALVKGAFTFSADDASFVRSVVYGEAMDSGDKALTKAQSVAFRTALFQTFVVPLVAMDPESSEYERDDEPASLNDAREQAMHGTKALGSWWESQSKETRVTLGQYLQSLKEAAAKADKDAK